MLKKIANLALALTAVGAYANPQAPGWPTKPITMIVPASPGGATDSLARAMAEEMGKKLGQTVIIENRPGAAGNLGTNAVAKAAPDGYTVVLAPSQSIMNNLFMFSRMPYDVNKDLAFVTQVATGQLVLAVNAQAVPARNVKELVAWAGANKGKVNYGSWGIGSFGHLAYAFMSRTKGLEMTHVPYKGEAPLVQDLVGGQIPLGMGSIGTIRPFIESGKLRALAVTGDKRLPGLPEVPTFKEAGLDEPEYRAYGWLVMLAPAGTPEAVITRLERETRAALDTTPVKARLHVLGLSSIGSSAQQFRKEYEEMMPVIERLVKSSGAKVD